MAAMEEASQGEASSFSSLAPSSIYIDQDMPSMASRAQTSFGGLGLLQCQKEGLFRLKQFRKLAMIPKDRLQA